LSLSLFLFLSLSLSLSPFILFHCFQNNIINLRTELNLSIPTAMNGNIFKSTKTFLKLSLIFWFVIRHLVLLLVYTHTQPLSFSLFFCGGIGTTQSNDATLKFSIFSNSKGISHDRSLIHWLIQFIILFLSNIFNMCALIFWCFILFIQ
jgi:hypothetical protein